MDIINKYFPNLTDRQKEQIAQLDALYREWNAKILSLIHISEPTRHRS